MSPHSHTPWQDDDQGDSDLKTQSRTKTKRPTHYRVLMLNDDFTPMDFVVRILEQLFGKSLEEATEIMLQIHHKGVGVCGVFTREVAETKAAQVMELARANQHPLRCTIERE